LLSVLAAALLGSFEPGDFAEVAERGAAMLLGCVYGWLVASTVLRHVSVESRAVHSQTAVGYAALLSVLVLTAWFVARVTGLTHGWWLPLAAAAIGEPALLGSSRSAAIRLAVGLCSAFVLVTLVEAIHQPVLRVACAALLLTVVFTVRPRTAAVQAMLLTPVAVALANNADPHLTVDDYVGAVLLAALLVFLATLLGKWVLWTLRPDTGHVAT
jgi:small basic protein